MTATWPETRPVADHPSTLTRHNSELEPSSVLALSPCRPGGGTPQGPSSLSPFALSPSSPQVEGTCGGPTTPPPTLPPQRPALSPARGVFHCPTTRCCGTLTRSSLMSSCIKCRCIVCNFPILVDPSTLKSIEPICSTECLTELSLSALVRDYDDAERSYPTTSLVDTLQH